MVEWIEIDCWYKLPIGEYLVAYEDAHDNQTVYGVVVVAKNANNINVCVVNGVFHFDCGNIIAYAEFNKVCD